MTYPLSTDVVAGQPTAADHYNFLRADALRLGQAAADSANLADLITRVEQNLTIQTLGTDRVRVPCTTSAPVSLVVDGYFILRSTNNVDLPSAAKPTGPAAMWYLFAVRTSGSSLFTLQANTSPLESSGLRLIGSFYWNGAAIEPASIRTTHADNIKSALNFMPYTGCQGRLSLDTSSPVKDGDTGVITLHPYKGNMISLYTPGWGWNNYPIQQGGTKPAFTPSTIGDKVYDVFAFWTGSAVSLEAVVWTNKTSRATPLTLTEGMYLKSTDLSRLYLGTFVAFLGSEIKDNPDERGLWNFFNRIAKPFKSNNITTGSWTYATPGTWRSPNGVDAGVRVVTGQAEDLVDAQVAITVAGGSTLYGIAGIGLDSNAANNADVNTHSGATSHRSTITARLCQVLTIGAHTLYWTETTNGSGSVTFYGQQFTGASQSGLTGIIYC